MQSRGLHVISAPGLLSNVWLCAMLKSIALKSIALQTVCLLLHGFPRLSVSLFMSLILFDSTFPRCFPASCLHLCLIARVFKSTLLISFGNSYSTTDTLTRIANLQRQAAWIYIIILCEPRWFSRLANFFQMLQAVPHWRSAAFSLPNYFIQWG